MKDIHYCLKDDVKYPTVLKNIKGAPDIIYYKGNIEIATEYKNVAVIGSRKCSARGMQLAYDTAKYLAGKERGVLITSKEFIDKIKEVCNDGYTG